MLALLRDDKDEIHTQNDTWVVEHAKHVLVRQGDLKLVSTGQTLDENQFELYNIVDDPTESSDLKAVNQNKFNELIIQRRKFKADYKVLDNPGGIE